jgi:hypothetical protein
LNQRNKSRKGLFTVTLLTVMAIALTVAVAAVTLGTFTGDEVTVGGVGLSSTVTYSLDNSIYSTTVEPSSTATSWYTRLEITDGDYAGPVTITWQLEQKTGPSTWTPVSGASTTTTVTLSGSPENIHASSDGGIATNYDWSADVTATGTYHVVATVESDTA